MHRHIRNQPELHIRNRTHIANNLLPRQPSQQLRTLNSTEPMRNTIRPKLVQRLHDTVRPTRLTGVTHNRKTRASRYPHRRPEPPQIRRLHKTRSTKSRHPTTSMTGSNPRQLLGNRLLHIHIDRDQSPHLDTRIRPRLSKRRKHRPQHLPEIPQPRRIQLRLHRRLQINHTLSRLLKHQRPAQPRQILMIGHQLRHQPIRRKELVHIPERLRHHKTPAPPPSQLPNRLNRIRTIHMNMQMSLRQPTQRPQRNQPHQLPQHPNPHPHNHHQCECQHYTGAVWRRRISKTWPSMSGSYAAFPVAQAYCVESPASPPRQVAVRPADAIDGTTSDGRRAAGDPDRRRVPAPPAARPCGRPPGTRRKARTRTTPVHPR